MTGPDVLGALFLLLAAFVLSCPGVVALFLILTAWVLIEALEKKR